MNDINLKRIADALEEILRLLKPIRRDHKNIWKRVKIHLLKLWKKEKKMINEKKVEQVRKFVWDMYQNLEACAARERRLTSLLLK